MTRKVQVRGKSIASTLYLVLVQCTMCKQDDRYILTIISGELLGNYRIIIDLKKTLINKFPLTF